MSEFLLEMKGVCKSFPGVRALHDASLALKPGKVHALMGENGAGKSTLMKCMFGIYEMDQGEIFIEGQPIKVKNPHDAIHYGLAMVHQELQPILDRSIAENIFVGRYPQLIPGLMIDHKKMNQETNKLLQGLGLDFEATTIMRTLSVSQMQLVEIAKAVSFGARVIILDEPTSSLTDNEVGILFSIIRKLAAEGCAIVYISHRMDEILKIADEVTIMRDGQWVGTWLAGELTTDFIISKMVGRPLENVYPPKHNTPGEMVLRVEDFTSTNARSFHNCGFTLRRGEILGVAGLVGAQRTEFMEGIFGLRSKVSGTVEYKGAQLTINSPKDAIDSGIALLTEDRRGSGIFGVLSVEDNVSVASLRKYAKFGMVLMQKRIDHVVSESINQLSIKTPSNKTLIKSLSGGNQQKVIISRWLANDPDIFILDEPTRGIDVGAKYEIYAIIADLAAQGKSVIMISSELPELIGMADRIMVMCEGRVTGFVEGADINQEKIMALATQVEA